MKAEKFITTIQWGSGPHYIAATYNSAKQVPHSLQYHRKRVAEIKARSKKGAKPTVMAWRLVEESE